MKKRKITLLIVGMVLLLSVIGAGCAIVAHAETYALGGPQKGIESPVQNKTVISTEGGKLTEEYEYGETVTAPTVTREGYTFVKWVYKGTNNEYIPGTMPAENIEVEAVWQINTYAVTYYCEVTVPEGEIGSPMVELVLTQHFDWNTQIASPAGMGTGDWMIPGKTFKGWSYNRGGALITTLPVATQNLTLYAVWETNKHTISFDSAGGSAVSSQQLLYGGYIQNPTEPTREGYNFVGWKLGGTTYILHEIEGFPGEYTYGFPAVTGNVTYTAVWELKSYHVNFNCGYLVPEGEIGSPMVEYVYPLVLNHFAAIVPPVIAGNEKEGYTFVGWSLDGVNVITLPATATQDVTYIAVWEKNSYTIIWDANGGTFVDP